MTTEKDKLPTEIKAVIEQQQSDIEALKTQLLYLTDTKIVIIGVRVTLILL